MPSTTAVQLVNRCLRRLRKNIVGDSTTFTSREAVDLLEYINEAKDDVLETRIWDFDRRQDVLTVHPKITPTTFAVIVDFAQFSATGGDVATATLNGDFVLRAVVTSDAAFGDTSFRVDYMPAGSPSSGGFDSLWKGTTNTVATGYLFAGEYMLPNYALTNETGPKYRQILSVMHQERDLQLVAADKDVAFDGFIQRLHENIGTDPTTVMVGGRAQSTRASGSADEETGEIMVVWPVPSAEVHLDYTAVLRHPKLVIPEDTLDDVDRNVENLIVSLAEALWHQGPGKDVQNGILLERRTRARIKDIWEGTRRQPLKRSALGSLEMVNQTPADDFGHIPRTLVGQ